MRKGFSLVEILIVIGITAVIGVVVLTSLTGRRHRVELENTARQIATLLREAQSRSMSQDSSTSWGVHFENSTTTAAFYELFSGTVYSTSSVVGHYRLPNIVRFATSSVPSGSSSTVIFAQITGLPSASTTISLELVAGPGGVAGPNVSRATSGLIFFDDFNRTSL